MNAAVVKRDALISSMADDALLGLVVAEPNPEEMSEAEFKAFLDMLTDLRSGERACLSKRQRAWVEEAARKIMPIAAADVLRGREVETPAVLRNLPKKPPGRL